MANLRADQTHVRILSERVWDLSYFVDLIYQRPKPDLRSVAGYFDLMPDPI